MLRYAVPVLAVLACAGCGGGARTAKAKPAAEPAPAPAAAPAEVKPVAQEPAPVAEKPRETRKSKKPVDNTPPVIRQPAAPELPAGFGLDTTAEELAAHALIVAQEQVASGLAGEANVLQRRDFLVQTWTPALQERQAQLAAIRDRRDREAKRQADEAGRQAEREAKLAAVEADYAHQLEVESRRTVPIESR